MEASLDEVIRLWTETPHDALRCRDWRKIRKAAYSSGWHLLSTITCSKAKHFLAGFKIKIEVEIYSFSVLCDHEIETENWQRASAHGLMWAVRGDISWTLEDQQIILRNHLRFFERWYWQMLSNAIPLSKFVWATLCFRRVRAEKGDWDEMQLDGIWTQWAKFGANSECLMIWEATSVYVKELQKWNCIRLANWTGLEKW